MFACWFHSVAKKCSTYFFTFTSSDAPPCWWNVIWSERLHSRLQAFRVCSDCSERLFTNARDNDQSQLTNGYLTPASARRYPNYFLNAPCMVLSDLLGNNIASAPLNASAVHSVGVFIDTQCDSQIIHQLWIQTSSALAFSYLCSWELHMQNLTKFTI